MVHSKSLLQAIVTCLLLFATSAKALENEGGAVSSNAGEIQWDCDPVRHNGKPTVFVITSADRSCGSLRMKINSMSAESMLHVYDSSHLSDEYTCGDRKNASWIGDQFNINGRMATLVLHQQECHAESTTFSVNWYCTGPIMDIAIASEDGAFVASESGMLSWTDVNAMQRHTTAITGVNEFCLRVNSDFGRSSTHDICQGTRLAVYEITTEGCLAGIHEICGRKSSFKAEPVSNNLLVVAEFNPSLTYGYSNSYEILWNEGVCQVEDSCNTTPEPTTEPPKPDVVINTDCGGILDLSCGQEGKIFYKNGTNYENNARCAWIIDSPAGAVDINFDAYTFEPFYDGCVIGEFDTNQSSFSCRKLYTANYNQTQRVNTPCVIQFTSDSSVTRPGFQISIAPVGKDCNRPYTVETFHSNSTDGTHRFPANGAAMYQGSARGLSVVQATPDLRNRAVLYGMVDLEEPNDWTQMFTMGPYTRANPCTAWERITGYHPTGTYSANTTTYTVASVTSSAGTGPASQSISWQSSDQPSSELAEELPKAAKYGGIMKADRPLTGL